VALTELPPGLVDGLPEEDQHAIVQTVGEPLLLTEYWDDETAELEFTDSAGVIHFIYVSPAFIRPVDRLGR